MLRKCSSIYNTVVFHDDANAVLVYLLATTNNSDVVMGGHFRIKVDSASNSVAGYKQYTNSCMVISRAGIPADAEVAALLVSHLLTPYPTEIHVFVSLQHGLDIYVTTVGNGALWKVSNGKIELQE